MGLGRSFAKVFAGMLGVGDDATTASAASETRSHGPQIDGTRYFYLGPDVALTRLQDGHFLFVDPLDETVGAHLIGRGFWEAWIQQAVCRVIMPGDTVIEVGSNVGCHTMAIAQRIGATGRLIAVEANPRLADLLKRSIEYNGYADRITLHSGVASDQDGMATFMTSRRNAGGGHTLVYEQIFGDETVTVQTQAFRLDVVAPDKVDFIRLDAEGSEPQILAGAVRHLANPDIILCMEWDVFQMSLRTSVAEFVSSLTQQGFRFWRIETDASLTPLNNEDMAETPHCEVLVSRENPERSRRP